MTEVITYSLASEVREALAPYHQEVQLSIALLANREAGKTFGAAAHDFPNGIHKQEGGVYVRQREIVIRRELVHDRRNEDTMGGLPGRNHNGSAEERAVVMAIMTIASVFCEKELDGLKDIWKELGWPEDGAWAMGDPLRHMLNVS